MVQQFVSVSDAFPLYDYTNDDDESKIIVTSF